MRADRASGSSASNPRERGAGDRPPLDRTRRPRAAPSGDQIGRNLLSPPTLGPAGWQGRGASWRACSLRRPGGHRPALVCTEEDLRNFSLGLRNGPDSHRSLPVPLRNNGNPVCGERPESSARGWKRRSSGARSRLFFFLLHCVACGILGSHSGTNPSPQQGKTEP